MKFYVSYAGAPEGSYLATVDELRSIQSHLKLPDESKPEGQKGEFSYEVDEFAECYNGIEELISLVEMGHAIYILAQGDGYHLFRVREPLPN